MKITRGSASTGTDRRRTSARRGAVLTAGVLAMATVAACSSSSSSASSSASSAAAAAPSATAASSAAVSAAAPSAAPASSAATPVASGSATVPCSPTATKLTMWGWAAGYNLAVAEFNKTHPDICVTLENNGASTAEYVKLGDAAKAGSGGPDVAEVEYFDLPSLEITKSLLDLTPYSVASYKATEAPVAWSQVSQGPAVYAMPVDLGPLALYYNSAVLAKYGIAVPTTWADFATAAAKLKAADPGATMTNFDPENSQGILALMQQDGAFPFTYTGGSDLGIHFTGAAETAFATYWQNLLAAKEVATAGEFSPAEWKNFDDGSTASRLSPAWGPVGMQLSMKASIGDWRAAALPQPTVGGKASGNWGGSTVAVMAASKHPKEAAEFAEWFGGSADSWKILSGPVAGAFPAYTPLLNDATFQATTLPISGTSTSNVIFAQAAQNEPDPEWPPIMTYALTQWTTSFAGVAAGTTSLPDAFKSYQAALVKYATAQGFKVTQ
jgi:multiple sugar transport system substrate-binding protein